MRERLAQKVGPNDADLMVQQLQAEGLLNDADFAQQWRDSRERHRPRGRRLLRQELRRRGVADDVIEVALADFDSDEVAYRAGHKFASKHKCCDERTFRLRVGAFLHRRGFEPDVIRRAVEGLNEELRLSASIHCAPPSRIREDELAHPDSRHEHSERYGKQAKQRERPEEHQLNQASNTDGRTGYPSQ